MAIYACIAAASAYPVRQLSALTITELYSSAHVNVMPCCMSVPGTPICARKVRVICGCALISSLYMRAVLLQVRTQCANVYANLVYLR
jgi:hypothetical protein